MDNKLIVLAGATGNLGGRIARALLQRGAGVIALVRHGSAPEKVEELRTLGATIAEVDFSRLATVTRACSGASCVVSALSGLRDVIVDSQTLLLNAALKAGVPRFIPSDNCIDFPNAIRVDHAGTIRGRPASRKRCRRSGQVPSEGR
jgi:uncharacterized protein YbjT (DUF2867 family)